MENMNNSVDVRRLNNYLIQQLEILPEPYSSQDQNRLTLLYFIISAADLIGLDDVIEDQRAAIIDFVYSLQVVDDRAGS